MTVKEWVRAKLIEHNFNAHEVKKLYPQFCKDTRSESNKESFRKEIGRCLRDLQNEAARHEQEKELQLEQFDRDALVDILVEETRKRGKPLNTNILREVAEDHGIAYEVFGRRIPDLATTLRQIYQENAFQIESSVTEEKLKGKITLLKRENDHLRKEAATVESITDAMTELCRTYTPLKEPEIMAGELGQREGVILVSDMHFDENVSEEETFTLGKYNAEIAKQRLDTLFNRVIENCGELGIKVLNIKFLGDMVSGIIHDELLINDELGITMAVIQLADYLAQWLCKLAENFHIKVSGIVGNHGRMFKKPHYKQKAELNFDFILYEFIRREVKTFVKEFTIPRSAFYIHDILDTGFMDIHGDTFLGGNGMNPISAAVNRDIAKLAGALRERGLVFNYVNMAHFHNPTETKSFDGIPIILNGSIIGPNEYSILKIKRAEKPAQVFYVVEQGRGMRYKDTIPLES